MTVIKLLPQPQHHPIDDYILSYVSLYVSRVGSKSHSFCATEDVHQLRAHKIEQQFDYEHHDDATSSVMTSSKDIVILAGGQNDDLD